jgi:hypothetical protein
MYRLSINPGALTPRTPQDHVGLFWGYFNILFSYTVVVILLDLIYLMKLVHGAERN